jgi:hypothetical protein
MRIIGLKFLQDLLRTIESLSLDPIFLDSALILSCRRMLKTID